VKEILEAIADQRKERLETRRRKNAKAAALTKGAEDITEAVSGLMPKWWKNKGIFDPGAAANLCWPVTTHSIRGFEIKISLFDRIVAPRYTVRRLGKAADTELSHFAVATKAVVCLIKHLLFYATAQWIEALEEMHVQKNQS